jgi:hypothetical protein
MSTHAKEKVGTKILRLRKNLSEAELECLSLKHEQELREHLDKIKHNRKTSDKISIEDLLNSF